MAVCASEPKQSGLAASPCVLIREAQWLRRRDEGIDPVGSLQKVPLGVPVFRWRLLSTQRNLKPHALHLR